MKTPAHIRAGVLICFTSQIIVRIIQYFMGDYKLSANHIVTALRTADCQVEKGGYVRLRDVGVQLNMKKR